MSELWQAVVASAIPVLIGGVAELLRAYTEPLQSFRDRTKLQRKTLIERLASKHADLLREVQRDVQVSGEFLREFVAAPLGADRDRIGEFTNETFRLFSVFYRLEAIGRTVRNIHYFLLASTILGLVGLLLAVFVPESRSVVLIAGVSVAGAQSLAVLTVFLCARKLDDYEETT